MLSLRQDHESGLPSMITPRFEKWQRWLRRITDDVGILVWSKGVYRRIREVVDANPSINTPNLFYNWMSHQYVHASLLGLRRQYDRDAQSISLFRIVSDIHAHPDAASRSAHRALYKSAPELADTTFDNLAGRGRDRLPPTVSGADLATLDSVRALHGRYTDKRVAHSDKTSEIKNVATYEDLFRAVDDVEALVIKYTLLLEAQTMSTLRPVPQYDWEKIFRVPWIPGHPE